MKQLQITVLALAVMLCGTPVFAQHGHGMGPGGGMNPAMGEGGSHRMSPNLSPSTHGVTMTQQLNTRPHRPTRAAAAKARQHVIGYPNDHQQQPAKCR